MTFLLFIIVWLPPIFLSAVFLAALCVYICRKTRFQKADWKLPALLNYKTLIISLISFYFLYAALKTFGQYYVWSGGPPSQYLLPPYQPIGYFVSYSWMHFWFGFFINIGVSFFFYLFLRFLVLRKSVIFRKEEAEMVFLGALLSGWPGVLLFVPMVFILTFLAAVLANFLLRKETIALEEPVLLTLLILFFWGDALIKIFNLGVLGV